MQPTTSATGQREMIAKFDSRCPTCGGKIAGGANGDTILWAPGTKAVHKVCPAPQAKAQRAAPTYRVGYFYITKQDDGTYKGHRSFPQAEVAGATLGACKAAAQAIIDREQAEAQGEADRQHDLYKRVMAAALGADSYEEAREALDATPFTLLLTENRIPLLGGGQDAREALYWEHANIQHTSGVTIWNGVNCGWYAIVFDAHGRKVGESIAYTGVAAGEGLGRLLAAAASVLPNGAADLASGWMKVEQWTPWHECGRFA